jgi:hypothetical protein
VLYATGDGQGGLDAVDGKPAGFSPAQATVAVDFAGYPAEISTPAAPLDSLD